MPTATLLVPTAVLFVDADDADDADDAVDVVDEVGLVRVDPDVAPSEGAARATTASATAAAATAARRG